MGSLVQQKRNFWLAFSFWITLFTCFSIVVHMNVLTKLDTIVAKFMKNLRTPDLTNIAIFISKSGSTAVYIAVLCLMFLLLYVVFCKRREAFILGFGAASTIVIYKSIKLLIERERPLEVDRLMKVTDFSYPSGHSVLTFVVYGYFAYIVWNYEDIPKSIRLLFSVICLLYIGMMGLSRIYVGVHFTTDVIGGYLLGAIVLTTCIRLTNKRKAILYSTY